MKSLRNRKNEAVPRTGTGTLAEKAKTCRVNQVKGIRQIGPVPSV